MQNNRSSLDLALSVLLRTPQVPGSRPGGYGTLSTDLLTDNHHTSISSLVCVEGCGRISRSGPTQDNRIGSYVFLCNVPHQWRVRQIRPVYLYYNGVWCHVLCLRHGIPLWQHIGQSTTTTSISKHCRVTHVFKSDIKPQQQRAIPNMFLRETISRVKFAPFCDRKLIGPKSLPATH